MGYSFEIAKQNSGINETFDISCHTTIIATNLRTKNFNAKLEATNPQQGNKSHNNSNQNRNNNKPIPDKTNDNCQQHQLQQQQPAKAKKISSTITNSYIFNCNNNTNNINGHNNDSNNRDDLTRKSNFYSLEARETLNKHSSCISLSPAERYSSAPQQQQEEDDHDELLQESCLNCYPLACHNRICCRQQNLAEIAREDCVSRNYLDDNCNNNKNHNNCRCCNNCCHCLASFLCQKHRSTLRNEQQSETNARQFSAKVREPSKLGSCTNTCKAEGHCLQRTLSQARASLTSNVVELKKGLVELMGNCASAVDTLMRSSSSSNTQCPSQSHCNNRNHNNNNKNNNNKSEPYRGYCQRKHASKPDFIPYTSANSCSLHDAIISSKHQHAHPYQQKLPQQQQHQHHHRHNHQRRHQRNHIKSSCNIGNNNSCNDCNATAAATTAATTATTTTTPTASSTQTAAFNYIGHNYYHFLRNSINFYTAYTASVLLVLCYLTTTTSAATTNSDSKAVDKHPIQGIDWSKFDESSSDKEILDMLLEKSRYDKRLLPPVNDEDFCCGMSSPDMATEQNSRRPHKRGTLTVNVNVLLLSLASPDESSLKYEVEFLLNQQWTDPRLKYDNKSQYDFLNALHHHENIWTPDTYFIMHGDFKDPIVPMHFALRIYRNGTITYAMRRHLILSCQGSLHIFPFDDPKCSFSMESISYEEAQIKYVWKNEAQTLAKSPSLTTLNAYLINNQTTGCTQNSWRGNYSCLRVDLIFTRDRAFYFTTVFIPGIILVTSSFITFWLEWNAVPARSMIGVFSVLHVELTFTRDRAYYFTTVFIPGIILVTSSFITFWLEWNAVPARVMIGVTTMLNFFTTSNGFRSTLPVVSNLTAMNVWDGVCMCFIYASLLEFVCVNYMGRKRPQHNVVYRPGENPVTQRLPAVLSRIGVILASPLEIVEREFNAAMTLEKGAGLSSAGTSMGVTPRPGSPGVDPMTQPNYQRQYSGGIISSAVQSLKSKSIKRRNVQKSGDQELDLTRTPNAGIYEHIYAEPGGVTTFSAVPTTMVTIETDITDDEMPPIRRTQSMSTNTPRMISKGDASEVEGESPATKEELTQLQMPVKPPRRKSSRSTSPASQYNPLQGPANNETTGPTGGTNTGEKKRDTGGPNEIVACTTCGGNSGTPCTHSANNGCATETCFVQVRKKEPPHPIRIAKTIDVIARITFPTAYAIFLIFFFVHYKGFS